jgi:hypothetical protein
MLKGHMSFLYLGCKKFHANRFVKNFYKKKRIYKWYANAVILHIYIT